MKLSPKKQKVLDFIESVEWLFDLQNYTRKICWKEKDKTEDRDVLADMTTNHKYRYTYMNVYPAFFKEDKETQCKALIHELCHTITEDMHDDWRDMYNGIFITDTIANHHRERTTENIAYLIFQL